MFLLVFALVAGVLGHPQITIDQDILVDVFGKPPAKPSENKLPRLEDIQITPTTAPSVYKDRDGDTCTCVPYYYCDSDLNLLDEYVRKYGGYGKLDVRFGSKEGCTESVERCCKNPKTVEPEVPVTPLKGCGYRNPNGLDFYVVNGNGNEAQYGEFPWVVAILEDTGKYIGVGVLIHPQVVMTGAHIANKYAPGNLTVRAGEWDTQTNKERLKSQERIVQDIVIREDFVLANLKNDIALLRLSQPVELAEHINVICMPDQDESFEGSKQCVANGWGKDVFGLKGRYAVILKKVEQDIVPHGYCNQVLKNTRLGTRFNLHKSFICAGGEEGKDTCRGDGGAPLACPIGNNRYKLSGLVAWGIGCGEKDLPAVYANVPMFRKWVDEVMQRWGLPTDGYQI